MTRGVKPCATHSSGVAALRGQGQEEQGHQSHLQGHRKFPDSLVTARFPLLLHSNAWVIPLLPGEQSICWVILLQFCPWQLHQNWTFPPRSLTEIALLILITLLDSGKRTSIIISFLKVKTRKDAENNLDSITWSNWQSYGWTDSTQPLCATTHVALTNGPRNCLS